MKVTPKLKHCRNDEEVTTNSPNVKDGISRQPRDKKAFYHRLHSFTISFNIYDTTCSYYVHPPGGWIYYFCFFRRPMSVVRCPMSGVRRPMSGVTHGFRSFKGKVLELLSPNLVCRLIGSVACLGLLLAVVPLLLTE